MPRVNPLVPGQVVVLPYRAQHKSELTLVAAAAMIVGATFGLLAETWANAMTSKSPAPAVAGSHG